MIRKKLQDFRKLIGLTQEEMAREWGITVSYYKKIEYGQKNPSIQKLKVFKERFSTANIDEIFLS